MYTLGFLSQSHIRGEEGSWQMNFKYFVVGWSAHLTPCTAYLCHRNSVETGEYSVFGKVLDNILNMNFTIYCKCSSNILFV